MHTLVLYSESEKQRLESEIEMGRGCGGGYFSPQFDYIY